MTRMELGTIVRETFVKGGMTTDRNGRRVTEGFAVGGVAPGTAIPAAEFNTETLGEAMGRLGFHDVFGTWLDKETGLVWVDAVDIFPFEVDAERAARVRGEIAYYDLTRDHEVRVDRVAVAA